MLVHAREPASLGAGAARRAPHAHARGDRPLRIACRSSISRSSGDRCRRRSRSSGDRCRRRSRGVGVVIRGAVAVRIEPAHCIGKHVDALAVRGGANFLVLELLCDANNLKPQKVVVRAVEVPRELPQ